MSCENTNFQNLNCILPRDYFIDAYDERIFSKAIAIVIHMHYSDSFDRYKKYIDNIPPEIKVFFTTSNDELKNRIQVYIEHRDNCRIIEKNNRGRDISSFLVACREEILKYEYVCFIHDKKEKSQALKSDTDKWLYSQWENILGSYKYLGNIISYFEKNAEVGLLLPPIPLGERISFAYGDNWGRNFENTVNLAKRLNLKCDINRENSPMAIGTVYWSRVDALRKLFEYEWKYEDFDMEPLAEDGTLSHAIERILEFVARDAGYESKWVMTDGYAEERLADFNIALSKAFQRLEKSLGIHNLYNLDKFDEKSKELQKLSKQYKSVYIYGAGKLGRDCLHFMKFIGIKIDAFIVTDMKGNESIIEMVPVSSIDEIQLDIDSLVLVAAKKNYQEEIIQNLKMNFECEVYNWYPYQM